MKTYYLLTLGCQMNISDSERIKATLEKYGLVEISEKSADLIVVNSCSVRQKPIDRIWGKLKVWQKNNPKAKKILTGCVLESDLKKLKQKFDYYFRIEDLKSFNVWLEKYLGPQNVANLSRPRSPRTENVRFSNYLQMPAKRSDKKMAFVPIMSGCNNFCSYCAVPYTRGREWSRKPEAIIEEVECLIKKGLKKVLLLGQNVNRYKIKGTKEGNGFAQLVNKLVKIKGQFKISFLSPHPKDFSDELIDLIAKEPKISKEIHLPMQSGDNEMLRKMNRGYKISNYLVLVEKMRKKIKGLKISTDIIVGFPGEKDKNFKNTVEIVKKIGFKKAYVSIYSPRPGTRADIRFKDSVSLYTKRKRWLILDRMINKKRL